MDFSWNATQAELYEKTLSFAHSLNASLPERERRHEFGRDEWRSCGEFGLQGLCVPEGLGGMGLDSLTTARVIEAFGQGCEDHGLVFSVCAHVFACVMPILEHATDELKNELLPGLCSGALIGANAITEAEAGSDVFAIKTRAVRDGDYWSLTGTKSFVTNGPVSDVIVTYASSNPAHGYLGISAFVVQKGTPGLTIGEPFQKMGLVTSPMSSTYFEDCRVPAKNMLGSEGGGAAVFTSSMQWERACLFAGYLGLMERQLGLAANHARERKQGRKRIGKNQAISHRIADMKVRLEAARLLLYRACWLRDQGHDAVMDVSLAKLAVSEAAIQSSLDLIQIHGGSGYLVETGIERGLRDAVPSTIFSGTSEIQRELIASRLGL